MRNKLWLPVAASILLAGTSLSFAQGNQPGSSGPGGSGPATSAPPPSAAPAERKPDRPADTRTQKSDDKPAPKADTPKAAPNAPTTTQNQNTGTDRRDTANDHDRNMKGDRRDSAGTDRREGTGSSNVNVNVNTKFTTEQRTRIKQTIVREKIQPVARVDFNIRVGTVVPRSVTLHPVPREIVEIEPSWEGYMIILVRNEILIVEPDTLRIVAVLQA